MTSFYFDSADEKQIEKWWATLSGHLGQTSEPAGITTNPSALQKAGVKTMRDLERKLHDLSHLMIRMGKVVGDIYVQLPNDNMHNSDVLEFARFLSKLADKVDLRQRYITFGLKIPPYQRILNLVPELSKMVPVNVTGVSDCSTALNAFSHNVRYVSIIPGRMEEQGIDAKSQVCYIQQRTPGKVQVKHFHDKREQQLITGSMRTLEGLAWVIAAGTVPTIGWRVFDKIVQTEESVKNFYDMWRAPALTTDFKNSPPVNEKMTQLSVDFFKQMNDCGKDIHEDFEKVIIL
jgi:transaldolase